jgi:uncharacterized protein YbbK (DUF523 family)/uncharacterized protein YbgA (DUF1722 family)
MTRNEPLGPWSEEIAVRSFSRPVVFVSRCLGFAACRYDGVVIQNGLVEAMRPYVEFQAVCPEMSIGLGAPRERIRIVRAGGKKLRLVQPATGRDLTDAMARFAELRLNSASGLHGLILKSGSPCCGIRDAKIYPGVEAKSPVGRGAGLFAAAALRKFPDLPIEDDARLADPRLRDHFLTRLFTKAAFEEVARTRSLRALVQFQAANELLLEAHSRREAAGLRRILANRERRSLDALLPDYRGRLARATARPALAASNVAAVLRAMELLSKLPLPPRERARFLAALERYRAGQLPLSVPRRILRAWVAEKTPDEKSRAVRTFLEPYPEALEVAAASGATAG